MYIIEKVDRNNTRYCIAKSENEVLSITEIANYTGKDELTIKQQGRFVGGRIYCSALPEKTGTCYKLADYIYFNERSHAEKFLKVIVGKAFDPHKRMEYIIRYLRRYNIGKKELTTILLDIRNNVETLTALGNPEKIEAYIKKRLGKTRQ